MQTSEEVKTTLAVESINDLLEVATKTFGISE